jgi:hypothetical protein
MDSITKIWRKRKEIIYQDFIPLFGHLDFNYEAIVQLEMKKARRRTEEFSKRGKVLCWFGRLKLFT